MKMSSSLFALLSETLSKTLKETPSSERHNMRMIVLCDARVKDESKRLRWDWLWLAKTRHPENIKEFFERAYNVENLDDTHIDTALKKWAAQYESARIS